MLFKQVTVNNNERVIVTRNGRFASILSPGSYRLLTWPWVSLKLESYDLSNPVFRSRWGNYLIEKKPHLIATHFAVVETKDSEIAMIFVDGMLYQVLLPGERALFWKDSASVSADVVSVIDSELPEQTLALELPKEEAEIDYFFSEP
jgi:hypothetical protein